jgi:hypothetical protein
VGCYAVASIVFFVAVFAPTLAALEPGSGVRPWGGVPLLAFFMAGSGWLLCLIAGITQLFARPRRYGLITIGFGVLQFAAFQFTQWLLMGSRGLYWAP